MCVCGKGGGGGGRIIAASLAPSHADNKLSHCFLDLKEREKRESMMNFAQSRDFRKKKKKKTAKKIKKEKKKKTNLCSLAAFLLSRQELSHLYLPLMTSLPLSHLYNFSCAHTHPFPPCHFGSQYLSLHALLLSPACHMESLFSSPPPPPPFFFSISIVWLDVQKINFVTLKVNKG